MSEKALGPEHQNPASIRKNFARLLLANGHPAEALTLVCAALAAHDKVLGQKHASTRDSARVTADALDALGRAEEAKTLREKYGLAEVQNAKCS